MSQSNYLILDIKELLDTIENDSLPGRHKFLFSLRTTLNKFMRASKKQSELIKKRRSKLSSQTGTRNRKEIANLFFGL